MLAVCPREEVDLRALLPCLLATGCISPLTQTEDVDKLTFTFSSSTAGTTTPAQPETEGDVVLLWAVYEPDQMYEPIEAQWTGSTPNAVTLVLGDPPPPEASYAIEDPVSGVQTDPHAPLVAMAQVALVAPGMLENHRSGVIALDLDKVLGMADLILFYTPIDLPDPAGVRWLQSFWTEEVKAGFHLFDPWNAEELPLDTPIVIWLGELWT